MVDLAAGPAAAPTEKGKVLVTGASGFVGAAIVRHLASSGYNVRAASRDPRRLSETHADHARMPDAADDQPGWTALVEGVDHVVHCAGIASASAGISAAVYRQANVDIAGALARAAKDCLAGRFVFLSSIRAVCGATAPEPVTDATTPRPDDDYGRSKLEAERLLASIFSGGDAGRLVILRPVAVVGEGAGGNIAALRRLAALPLPLPLGGLDARRSLLDVDSLAGAVRHVLGAPKAAGGTFTVCDRPAVSIGGIVTAMRTGAGRRPALFSLPKPLFAAVFSAFGKGAAWDRISGPLTAEARGLEETGWHAGTDMPLRLAALAKRSR